MARIRYKSLAQRKSSNDIADAAEVFLVMQREAPADRSAWLKAGNRLGSHEAPARSSLILLR